MKYILSALVLSSVMIAPAMALEPIKGSMTYNGQPQTMLGNTPSGSVIQHRFTSRGENYTEIYVVGPNGGLELVSRVRHNSQ